MTQRRRVAVVGATGIAPRSEYGRAAMVVRRTAVAGRRAPRERHRVGARQDVRNRASAGRLIRRPSSAWKHSVLESSARSGTPLALLRRMTTNMGSMLDGLRVLVIEDHADLRDLFATLLAADGAEASTAGTGCAALDLYETESFDAVLCDLGLPDVSGEVVIREINRRSSSPPPVAVITGQGEPHLARARTAGAQAVFAKPVEWARVAGFLRRLKLAAAA